MKKLVLAVDVAKDKSTYGLFGWKDGDLVTEIRPFDVKHTAEGFACLWKRLEGYDRNEIECFMEATGGLQLLDCFQLMKNGFSAPIVVNPIYVKQNKGNSLRKLKTDPADCRKIARTYFEKKYQCSAELTQEQLERRKLSRMIESYVFDLSEKKVSLREAIHKTFPELENLRIFEGDRFFGASCLNLLEHFSSAEEIAERRVDAIESVMVSERHLKSYGENARMIKEAARKSTASCGKDSVEAKVEVRMLVSDMRILMARIEELENILIDQMKDDILFRVVNSFDGIGKITAAHITAEIGSVDNFMKVSKLLAFAGIEPRQDDSGDVEDNYGRITKCGNPHLRKSLFVAVKTIIMQFARGGGEKSIAEYYKKMHSQRGKHYYASMVACMNKLLRKIFYRYKESVKSGEVIKR